MSKQVHRGTGPLRSLNVIGRQLKAFKQEGDMIQFMFLKGRCGCCTVVRSVTHTFQSIGLADEVGMGSEGKNSLEFWFE